MVFARVVWSWFGTVWFSCGVRALCLGFKILVYPGGSALFCRFLWLGHVCRFLCGLGCGTWVPGLHGMHLSWCQCHSLVFSGSALNLVIVWKMMYLRSYLDFCLRCSMMHFRFVSVLN